ncbi:hypothetical protein [Pasteuria penetrans]|nr:hypothetical protein [Pasteuria penetrans]
MRGRRTAMAERKIKAKDNRGSVHEVGSAHSSSEVFVMKME